MSNQKEQNVGAEQVQEAPVQAEPQQQTAPQTEEKKGGFGAFVKQHWKGLVATVTGALAIGGSAVVAYKKGKAAGMNYCPPPTETEDYGLNPNE